MILTNQQIYTYAKNFSSLDLYGIKLPVKINFFLQKNIQIVLSAGKEIDSMRTQILEQFGELNEDKSQFIIAQDNTTKALKELNDLLSIEQNLNIHIFKLSEFDNIDLTYEQLSAIMFMIEE